MNPFNIDERHKYIILHNGQLATSPAEREDELNINLINIDLDTPIYRYMKWEYLRDFYTDPCHRWVLVNPSRWQDKFEHFIFKCEKFYNPKLKAEVGLNNIASQYYAQCWTLTEECSMQWQVNKPHSNNAADNNPTQDGGEIWVKIRTTPRKLLGGMFYSANNLVRDTFNVLTYFLGKVRYVDDDYIRNYQITDPNEILDQNGLQQVLFLLWKRMPYKCENEVRLIMQVDSVFYRNNPVPIVKRQIDDWYELIEEIIIDPWASDQQVLEVKNYINSLSIQEHKAPIFIGKSHLNDVPNYIVPTISI